MATKNKYQKTITTFDEHLDKRYGKIGTKKRTNFESKAKLFAIGIILKEEDVVNQGAESQRRKLRCE